MDLKDLKTQRLLNDAVRAGMSVVRNSQGGLIDNPEIKDDKTLVTTTDRLSEEKIVSIIRQEFPNIRIVREEGAESGDSEIGLLIDPLDGTRAFASGLATSTVIIGVYDFVKKQVVGCVIGEAATGRVRSAFEGDRTFFMSPMDSSHVWDGPLDEQSTVFLDVSHGFSRKGRQILTDEHVARLFGRLNGKMKLAIPGSNGLIQSLVANGGQRAAGSITTAIGGPWDVCGVKLVLNAGGSARAFSTQWRNSGCALTEQDPLDVMGYDILICGNSTQTVKTLVNELIQCIF
ncbi:hypothetical protein KW800_02885 [Candidatus Parcubacteria bacterium]|nr:hypothetical protein [Candidatus Parcubacteria bacterium]